MLQQNWKTYHLKFRTKVGIGKVCYHPYSNFKGESKKWESFYNTCFLSKKKFARFYTRNQKARDVAFFLCNTWGLETWWALGQETGNQIGANVESSKSLKTNLHRVRILSKGQKETSWVCKQRLEWYRLCGNKKGLYVDEEGYILYYRICGCCINLFQREEKKIKFSWRPSQHNS